MAVIGLVWLFATGTLTYAAGQKLTTPPTAPTPVVAPRQTLIVPDIRGQAFVFAKGILEDGGFAWHVSGAAKGYATNVVVSQQPAAGTRVQDTGAPRLVLTLKHGTYGQDGTPENDSPYAGTAILLAKNPNAPAKKPAAGKLSLAPPKVAPAKAASTPKKKAAAKHKVSTHKASVAHSRPAAFVVPGARKEPLDEIPLTLRASRLGTWVAKGRAPTAANVRYWAYQHAWIVTGAKFGWWHGAQALRTLIRVDKRLEGRWHIGSHSEAVARAALAQVEAKSR